MLLKIIGQKVEVNVFWRIWKEYEKKEIYMTHFISLYTYMKFSKNKLKKQKIKTIY